MNYYRPSLLRKIFAVITVLVLTGYLLVCSVPYVNTSSNWFVAIPGIIFPLLAFLLLGLMIYWICVKSRWAWACVVVFLLGIQQIRAVFSFHTRSDIPGEKPANTLRVLQWNVMGWDQGEETKMIEGGGHSLRPVMMEAISDQNADVLCLDEFFQPKDTLSQGSNIALITRMGYPYHVFSPTKNYRNDSTLGVIIFSKYPMVASGAFDLDRSRKGDHLVYMDIRVRDQVFRIFATHLIAINFAAWDDHQEEDPGEYRTLFSKLIRGYNFRYYQAELVGQKIAASPYPSVICGDFNDIPNSSTYFKIKGDLQDTFLKKGYGTGRTTRRSFLLISPRIDYILAGKAFHVSAFQTLPIPYSDHFPVEADLQY